MRTCPRACLPPRFATRLAERRAARQPPRGAAAAPSPAPRQAVGVQGAAALGVAAARGAHTSTSGAGLRRRQVTATPPRVRRPWLPPLYTLPTATWSAPHPACAAVAPASVEKHRPRPRAACRQRAATRCPFVRVPRPRRPRRMHDCKLGVAGPAPRARCYRSQCRLHSRRKDGSRSHAVGGRLRHRRHRIRSHRRVHSRPGATGRLHRACSHTPACFPCGATLLRSGPS